MIFGGASLALSLALLLVSVILRQGLLFVVSLILALTTLAAWLWDRYGLARVEYRRRFSQPRAFFGEEIGLTVEVVNRKLLPLAWLLVEDEIPSVLTPVAGRVTSSLDKTRSRLVNLVSLRWYERVRRHYQIRCTARGYHAFGPVTLRSGDLFGFSQQERVLPGLEHLLVYPKVVPIDRLGLPSQDPFGDLRTRQWLFEDPQRTIGVRDYLPGDSPRRIDWKATARTHQLQVKLYEPTTTYRLIIFLNLNTIGPYWWWQAYDPDLLELAITTAASVAAWAVERGYQVGLSVNGREWMSDHQVSIPPSRDPEQLTRVLEALAKLAPVAASPLEARLQSETARLAGGFTVVVVTAVLNEAIGAQLWALRAAGRRVGLLLIGDPGATPQLADIPVYRVPRLEEDSALELASSRQS